MKRRGTLLAIVAASTFCLGPFAWQAMTALRPEGELGRIGPPSRLSLENFRGALTAHEFVAALKNSFLVATVTTIFALVVGASASFAIAKLRFPGKRLLLATALAISMFPPIATVGPLYVILKALGLLDHWVGLVLPYGTFTLPLAIWVLTGFFARVPDEVFRAALVDGCSPFQAFTKVMLPLVAPGLGTTAILVFIFAWNELLWAITFTSSPEHRTVPASIALFAAEHREPWGEIAAASVVATLPLVVVTLLFQRAVVAGLTAGAVKG